MSRRYELVLGEFSLFLCTAVTVAVAVLGYVFQEHSWSRVFAVL